MMEQHKFRFSALLILAGSLAQGCGTNHTDPAPANSSGDSAATANLPEAPSVITITDEVLATEQEPEANMIKSVVLKTDPNLNLCEGLVTHTDRVAIKPVGKPPYLKYYREPAFGTKVIRITNSANGAVQKPAYSTMQAWNADESLLMLYQSGGSGSDHVLLDGHTYQPIRGLNIYPSDVEEVFWSHNDPDILYYISKDSQDLGLFKKLNVRTNKTKVVKDFSKYCGLNVMPVAGGDVHMQSLDDDLWGFRCQKENDESIMLTYRISTDEVQTAPIGEGTSWGQWYAPTPAPSGKNLWYQGAYLSPDLSTVNRTMDMAKTDEHSNIGQTYDGKDALFQTVFDPSPKGCNGDVRQGVAHLTEFNLETGECRPIISESNGYPYTTSGTHISARAIHKPGWVAMSSIGYGQFEWFTNGRKAPVLFSEIYLANTDPDNSVVCRLAHHRSYSKDSSSDNYHGYFGEPHATISPSGTRIIFGSDWYDSGSVDSYVIELPGYQRTQ